MMIEKFNDGELFDGVKQVRDLKGESFGSIKDLTYEEIEKLRVLNSKLTKYEKVMRQESEVLSAFAQQRFDDEDDRVVDFEMSVSLYFYLDSSDPAYSDDDKLESDNLLTILHTSKSGLKWDWGYGDEKCHNTIPNREGTAMEHDKHCATFHSLYDHTELSYQEISSISLFEFYVLVKYEF